MWHVFHQHLNAYSNMREYVLFELFMQKIIRTQSFIFRWLKPTHTSDVKIVDILKIKMYL